MTRFPFYLALAGAMLSTAVARQADAEEGGGVNTS